MAWTFNDYSGIYTTSDGTKILLGIPDWAQLTLTGDDLAEWETDLATIQAYETPLMSSGDLTSEYRDTTVTIDDTTYTTLRGRVVTFPNVASDAAQPTLHTLWDKWATRMQADSNVTWITGAWKNS